MTRPPGVWMIYHHDYGPRLDSIHTSLEDATQAHVEKGWGEVGYLPYGVELDAAVKAWERGEYKQDPEPKVEWRDPAPQTNEEVADALSKMAKSFGVKLDDWQSQALRYFLSDTVTGDHPDDVRCGDHPAPCNHDPAHSKDNQ